MPFPKLIKNYNEIEKGEAIEIIIMYYPSSDISRRSKIFQITGTYYFVISMFQTGAPNFDSNSKHLKTPAIIILWIERSADKHLIKFP